MQGWLQASGNDEQGDKTCTGKKKERMRENALNEVVCTDMSFDWSGYSNVLLFTLSNCIIFTSCSYIHILFLL